MKITEYLVPLMADRGYSKEFMIHQAVTTFFGKGNGGVGFLVGSSVRLRGPDVAASGRSVDVASVTREVDVPSSGDVSLTVRLSFNSGSGSKKNDKAASRLRDERLTTAQVLAKFKAYGLEACGARVFHSGQNHKLAVYDGKPVYANDVKLVAGNFTVVDPALFKKAMEGGIGARRSYGYGFIEISGTSATAADQTAPTVPNEAPASGTSGAA